MFFETAKSIGNKGEKAAAKFLKKEGYRILKRNFRSAHGEIDIIASNKEYIVFVEVKTRKESEENFKNYGRPGEAVTKTKQQHIIYTANIFLNKFPTDKAKRFDVIEVFIDDKMNFNHIVDAFCL